MELIIWCFEDYKTKVIVQPNPNIISATKSHSNIKSVATTVQHEPPDKPKRPKTTTREAPHKPPSNFHKLYNLYGLVTSRPGTRLSEGMQVTENIVESKPLRIKNPYANRTYEQYLNANNPHRGNVIDWFLGIVGIRPPDPSPAPVKPSKDCPACMGVTPPDPNPPSMKPAKECPACTCGQTYKRIRIVGGIETMVNEYVWMTALMYNNRFLCGASLINNKYILTAAHCVNGFSREKFSAVFLDHDRSTPYETQTIMRKIKNIYRHSSYGSSGIYNNDIALMQLDQEIPLTGMIRPVCLPPTGKSFTNFKGIAVGWGATKEHGQVSNKLQEVTVPIMSNVECRKTGYGYKITDNMLCAGYHDGKKDSCQSMSKVLVDLRIVSWGEGCAQANFPGVYTRVNRYISWIKSNTRDACYC
ncbi:hypothetical protein NQ318_012262 [Aromia moschata]|uniref:Peptidase S1 domain-containing protein n=1 Tax=Aromia moschata TaxID=1265417 RepID=A0AAV8XGH2_9CUCU|nr:hypothetical protein NQ318_012262 [Aromia moschata]